MTSTGPVAVVVPVYNEADVLPEFWTRLVAVFDRLDCDCEVIFVNDGSTDSSLEMLVALANADPRVSVLDLSRNFGKEIALTAGLDSVRGDAAIPIDADLQDPPEVIPQLVEKWREGFDMVYATRRSRSGESWHKRATAAAFYRILGRVSETADVPADTGDFRIIGRRALDAFCQMRERHRFLKGLFATVGFRTASILYDRDPRFAGQSKWNYRRLVMLSVEGITSHSIAPLRLATFLGIAVAFVAFVYAAWIVYKTLWFGDPVAGYPSLMTAILMLGGVQLTTLGIVGEYLGRVFNEVKGRPLYFVQRRWPQPEATED